MTGESHRTRRHSLSSLGRLLAGPATVMQDSARRRPLPPSGELVNVPEFEAVAELAASPETYRKIAGSDRRAFDRMTFRQRLMVDATKLDLTTELFGHSMFAPILIGPVSGQQEFHRNGELETVRGAAAAQAPMIVSSRSNVGIAEIARHAMTPLWFQVYTDDHRDEIAKALDAGVTAVCITVNRPAAGGGDAASSIDWGAVERLREGVDIPLVIKGIMTPDQARAAVEHGAQGIIVSSHGAPADASRSAPIEVLPAVADAITNVPILIDGSFRRGTDILKALALGARAVLLARPVMWGLAAYGAEGVQTVLELLYNELARSMAASGRPTIAMIDRALVTIHSR